ncbi:hypothetical protein ACIA5D_42955 [Actinoplanes sp. NPDC051513]|uniref:hypothetical protein n=1 Tax=Actinoplanes sp. NPDC051513 TaxID=3363908 RepID=UPI003792946E
MVVGSKAWNVHGRPRRKAACRGAGPVMQLSLAADPSVASITTYPARRRICAAIMRMSSSSSANTRVVMLTYDVGK